jgi:hypothetical protein
MIRGMENERMKRTRRKRHVFSSTGQNDMRFTEFDFVSGINDGLETGST